MRARHSEPRVVGWRLRPLLVLLLLVGSCATLGPPYQPLSVPPGQAVIYFYRPDAIEGAALAFNVRQGDRVLAELQVGSYFPLVVRPGLHAFWARTETRAEVRVPAE